MPYQVNDCHLAPFVNVDEQVAEFAKVFVDQVQSVCVQGNAAGKVTRTGNGAAGTGQKKGIPGQTSSKARMVLPSTMVVRSCRSFSRISIMSSLAVGASL